MIVVNARIQTSPEAVDAMRAAMIAMQTASQAEDGCEDYNFAVELAEPGVIRITERWTSREALIAHFQTPHMAEFLAAMQARPPGESAAHFYEATEIEMPR